MGQAEHCIYIDSHQFCALFAHLLALFDGNGECEPSVIEGNEWLLFKEY